MTCSPPSSTLFPYTTLFRSQLRQLRHRGRELPPFLRMIGDELVHHIHRFTIPTRELPTDDRLSLRQRDRTDHAGDRKSTRLNSSHRCISYAVFWLKKKSFDD